MKLQPKIAKWSKIFTETQPNGLHPNAKRHKKAKKMLRRLIGSITDFDRTKWAQDPVRYCKMMLKTGLGARLNMLDILLEPHKTKITKLIDSKTVDETEEALHEAAAVMGQPWPIVVNNIMFIEIMNIDLTDYLATSDSPIAYMYYSIIEKKKENKTCDKKICNECIMKDIIETKTQFDAKVST